MAENIFNIPSAPQTAEAAGKEPKKDAFKEELTQLGLTEPKIRSWYEEQEKKINSRFDTKEDEVKRNQMIETLGNAITKLGAAMYGSKKGVDLSTVKGVQTDFSKDFDRLAAGRESALGRAEGEKARRTNLAERIRDRQRSERAIGVQERQIALKEKAQEDAAKAPKTSKAQEAVDKAYSKQYADYVAGGGRESVKSNISKLQQVHDDIDKIDTATGRFIGVVPKWARDIITPEGAAMQDIVESVVQENLRETLGAQFTENEAKQLIARAYNPRLDESENKRRLGVLLDQMKAAAKAKDDAARYYEENGTLKGFKGDLYKSANDFLKEYKDKDSKDKPKEVIRSVKGRKAAFNPDTKEFIRWVD